MTSTPVMGSPAAHGVTGPSARATAVHRSGRCSDRSSLSRELVISPTPQVLTSPGTMSTDSDPKWRSSGAARLGIVPWPLRK